MAAVTDRLPVGIGALDKLMNGGVTAGSIIVLSASPASQSELLLSQLTDARRTLYLTTARSRTAVSSFLERSGADSDGYQVKRVDNDATLENAYRLIRLMSHESNLVIDTMDPLEDTGQKDYWNFMNALKEHLEQTNSLAFLHCLDGRNVPDQRDTTEYMSDVIFNLSTEFDGEEIINRLLVPKVRGGETVNSAIKLDLSQEVTVDTSRDIA